MTTRLALRLLSILSILAILAIPAVAVGQQTPTPEAAPWWNLTTALANDAMQGRDTGTPAYQRAADFVAQHFKADGLQPAGDDATFFQRVPMHQVDLDQQASAFTILHPHGEDISLRFSTQITTTPHADLDLPPAPLLFLGYGLPASADPLTGRIVIFFNNIPAEIAEADRTSFSNRRLRALNQSGAAAILAIDNPCAIEPFHWPAAYARSVTLAANPAPNPAPAPYLRINPEVLSTLFSNQGTLDADALARTILAHGCKGEPLASFPVGLNARLHLHTTAKDIASPNILAILPGADPTLAPEYLALSAHLDGYGFGTPVNGDPLYNGALDDAAYVATLLDLAHTLAQHPPKRSLLFCIFTGEEKGLLGSDYFTHHPTVPTAQIVADLNLDQLRPIFPLDILTMEGIADSSLGETARTVAASFHIELRPDREPERNLFRRADNYNFVRIGVPIAGFIFGYDPGTSEEKAYRNWYATRYHKPQDDLTTPIDWAAAVKFNDFYRALTLKVADDPARPTWLSSSRYAPDANRGK